jgi:hypothetical protein
MIEAFRGLNRLDEGREVVERLIAGGGAGETERAHLYEIAVVQRD